MERTEDAFTGEAYAKRIHGGGANAAGRERNWSEMGLEEKVERLQRLCKALVNVNNRMADRLEEAHHTSHFHVHDKLDRVHVPPRSSDLHMNYPLNALRVSDHDIR